MRTIVKRWYEALGGGFHLDDAGAEYVDSRTGEQSLTDEECADFDADMAWLHTHVEGCPYAFVMQVISELDVADSFCDLCGTPLTEDNAALNRDSRCKRCGGV